LHGTGAHQYKPYCTFPCNYVNFGWHPNVKTVCTYSVIPFTVENGKFTYHNQYRFPTSCIFCPYLLELTAVLNLLTFPLHKIHAQKIFSVMLQYKSHFYWYVTLMYIKDYILWYPSIYMDR